MTGPRVLLTGASAGIGMALADHYAKQGATLGLVARRTDRLEAAKAGWEAAGAKVFIHAGDVRDAARMGEIARAFWNQAGGVDIVIANAGISESDGLRQGDPKPASDVIAVNVQGAINTLLPVIPLMLERESGRVVAIGSVAGFRGLPGKGAYSASKAAVKTLMDAWRVQLRGSGVSVTTICPGYVESELTDGNTYPMPFLMPANKAARLISHAIDRRASTYIFPWQMRWIVPLLRTLPDALLSPMTGRR
ncbi:MAG TPA: SDR family oxidoreductase [bacterium]